MAKIPEPQAGLVFRYRYLRIWQYQRGEQAGKERPCCLLLPLTAGQEVIGNPIHNELGETVISRYIAENNDVLILLIQSDRPGQDQIGLELTIEDKRYVGLDDDAPSYIIVSEANVDKWPNADMCLIPGRQSSFTYSRPLPGPTFARVMRAFLKVREAKKSRVLVRHP